MTSQTSRMWMGMHGVDAGAFLALHDILLACLCLQSVCPQRNLRYRLAQGPL